MIIESHWAGAPKHKQFPIENNSTCWKREQYSVIQDCHPCTAFEIASKSQGVCIHTHYKELLRCKSGETVTRSCDKVAWLDEKDFWTFEGTLFVVGVIFTSLSMLRQKALDRKTQLRIQRQLDQSV